MKTTKDKYKEFFSNKTNKVLCILSVLCLLVAIAFTIVLIVTSVTPVTLNRYYSYEFGEPLDDSYLSLSIVFEDDSSGRMDGFTGSKSAELIFVYKLNDDYLFIKPVDGDSWECAGKASPYKVVLSDELFGISMDMKCNSAITTRTISCVFIPVGFVAGFILLFIFIYRTKKTKKERVGENTPTTQSSKEQQPSYINSKESKESAIVDANEYMREEINKLKKQLELEELKKEYETLYKQVANKEDK